MGSLHFVELRFVELRFVELRFVELRFVELRFVELVAVLVAVLLACGGEPPCERETGLDPSGDCESDTECGARVCARVADATDDLVARLTCMEPSGAPPGTRCTDSSECAHRLCVAAGTCRRPCSDSEDCSEDERCAAAAVVVGEAMQRAPVCVSRAHGGTGVTIERTTRSGKTWRLPGNGLHVLSTGCPAAVLRLDDDLGTAFDAALRDGSRNPLFVVDEGPPAIWLPSGDTPIGGDPRVTFDRFTSGELITFRGGGGQRLDIDLYFVGFGSPEGERGPVEIAAAFDEVDRIFASAGIRIGEVRQHEVRGMLAARLSILDGERGRLPELEELFSLGAGSASAAIPIFLVRDIDFSLGLSGGVPGPLGVDGLPNSGIVLAAEVLGDRIADALPHELGHFLGLFHTTELDGTVIEAFSDSPACVNDDNRDGVFSADECAGADGSNLMFWSAQRLGSELTASQQNLLAGATLLR